MPGKREWRHPFAVSHRALLCRGGKRQSKLQRIEAHGMVQVFAGEVVVIMVINKERRRGMKKACYRIRSGGKGRPDHYVQESARACIKMAMGE